MVILTFLEVFFAIFIAVVISRRKIVQYLQGCDGWGTFKPDTNLPEITFSDVYLSSFQY